MYINVLYIFHHVLLSRSFVTLVFAHYNKKNNNMLGN